jgi:hypothetical protein
MKPKAAALAVLCVFIPSLCLTVGCGSNSASNQPAKSPGYFGSAGKSPGEALELDLQNQAKSKPTKRAR